MQILKSTFENVKKEYRHIEKVNAVYNTPLNVFTKPHTLKDLLLAPKDSSNQLINETVAVARYVLATTPLAIIALTQNELPIIPPIYTSAALYST